MDKLTIEQKAKRYDEAIKIARALNSGKHIDIPSGDTVCECIFPELKKKTDEEMIQKLITVVHLYYGEGVDTERDECLEWLDKQINKFKETDICTVDLSECSEEYRKAYYDGYNKCNRNWFERQSKYKPVKLSEEDSVRLQRIIDFLWYNRKGDTDTIYQQEQDIEWLKSLKDRVQPKQSNKPQGKSALEIIKEEKVDNANKVESKFKVGDWVVKYNGRKFCNNSKFAQITKIDKDEKYWFDCGTFLRDKKIRHWTIEDAEDGDILASYDNKAFIYNGNFNELTVGSYCGLNIDNEFVISDNECAWCCNCNIKPATEKQRIALFDEMNFLNYTWNPETKELNRLDKDEQNNN